jgi:hypothetical protein
MSKCPRSDCTGMSFTMRELKVSNSNYKLNSVECSICGAVVGVMEFTNVSAMLHKLGKKLGVTLP